MFRFPSPSLSWRWVGQSGKKKSKHKHVKGSECHRRPGCSVRKLGCVVLSFVIRWCNRNRTTKCLKRLQKRSIDDNLRQLVLKTRSCACKLKYLLLYKWFWIFFFLLFQKNGSVGRWETTILWGWPKCIWELIHRDLKKASCCYKRPVNLPETNFRTQTNQNYFAGTKACNSASSSLLWLLTVFIIVFQLRG